MLDKLHVAAVRQNITLIATESVHGDALPLMRNIKERDGRIIVVESFPEPLAEILCAGYQLSMYGMCC